MGFPYRVSSIQFHDPLDASASDDKNVFSFKAHTKVSPSQEQKIWSQIVQIPILMLGYVSKPRNLSESISPNIQWRTLNPRKPQTAGQMS